MRFLKFLVIPLIAVAIFTIAAPATYAASWNPFDTVDCSGDPNDPNAPASSAVCQDSKGNTDSNPLTGADGIIMKVVNVIAWVAGAAAVIVIILAGLRYIQSGGNSEDVAGAKRAIIYAIIGLVFIILARFIIALIVKGL